MTSTITEPPAAGEAEEASAAPATARPRATGLAGLLGSGDHRTIGKVYIAASILFLVIAGVAGVAVGVERVDTSSVDVFSRATDAAQILSLHSVAGVFLFLLPLTIGIATYVVPLQVGASTVAFPRAAAAALWTYLLAGGTVIAAYAINGGPFGGDAEGVDLFLAAFGAVLVALLLGTICVVTTVLAARAKGMTLDRVPLFSWSMLVAGSMWLLSLPVLCANVILLYVDHRYGRVLFDGNVGVYGNILWTFRQPQLYAFAVPALGFAGDVVPVFARTAPQARRVELVAIGAVGVLGFGAWAQPALAPDLTEQALWVGMAVAVLLPLLLLLAIWGDTLRRGSIRFASPLVFAVAAVIALLAGAAAGAIGSVGALDLRIEQGVLTTWDAGQAHYVLLAAAIAAIGGLHYWAPAFWRRSLKDGLGQATAVLLLLGTVTLAIPDLYSAAIDQPAFLGTLESGAQVRDGVEALNIISLVGGGLIVLGVVLLLTNVIASLGRKASDDPSARDPWEGQTLEWATGDLPEITSATPLLDRRTNS